MTIKFISSRENATYKEIKQLASSPQVRRKSGRTVLDGIHLCDAYLSQIGRPVICIAGESAGLHPEVAAILERCKAMGTDCLQFPDTLYRALRQVEHGVDIMFVVNAPAFERPPVLNTSAVLLDTVQDPGNLGSILRSAAAAGVRDVYCSPGTTFVWSPKVLRAGMGAHFHLRLFENINLAQLIQTASVPVIATSSHASQTIFELDLTTPCGWLFGNEGNGVSLELLSLASHQVSIPHAGAIESLNVAACAAVCFFEQLRQSRLLKT